MRFRNNWSQFILFGYDFEQPELRNQILWRIIPFFLIGFLLGAIAFLIVILSIYFWGTDVRELLSGIFGVILPNAPNIWRIPG